MPKIIQDESGQDIEVFTPEEVAEQKQQAIEEYKTQNPDKTEEIQRLQNELAEKEKSLAGLKDKDINVGNLRKSFESQIDDLKKNIDTKVGEVKESTKKEVLEGVRKDFYNKKLVEKSSGDEELRKKVEFHYNRLSDPVATDQDIERKLEDAYRLATAGQEQSNSSAFSSAGASAPKIKPSELTEDDKDLLNKMGKGHLIK